MATSKTPDTLTAIASLSQATNLPPKTDETKPRPWEAPQLSDMDEQDLVEELAYSQIAECNDLDEIPFS